MALQIRVFGGRNALIGANEALLCVLLIVVVLFGGTGADANFRTLFICIAASALLASSLVSGGWEAFRKLPGLAQVALVLIPCVPLLQLVPLPPGVWSALPGREAAKSVFALIGATDEWHPLTLTPRSTLFALLMLLAPYAAFFAALTLDDEAQKRSMALFVALAGLSILVGLVQVGSRGASLDFYNTAHRGHLIGFFANRNHEALMLAIAAVFGVALVTQSVKNRLAALAWSAILSITFLGATIATSSRAGMALAILGLLIISYILFSRQISRKQWIWLVAGLLFIGAILYLLSISRVAEQAIARYNMVHDDDRWTIWRLTWPLVGQYAPWGSGLGSFVPAYTAIEALDNVAPSYINRAHNDYLETLIETGVPGMAVLAIFGLALASRGVAAMRKKVRLGVLGLPAGIGILLTALHSFVDYPLRSPAIAVIFAIMLAFFLSDARAPREVKRVRIRSGGQQNIQE